MPERLPPLQNLKAFEAAGRRLSMTLAAEELHLTHGAVSRQIRTLEDHLGVRLFHRLTRRIELTEEGAAFFAAVTRLLSDFGREVESIRRRSETGRLTISSGVSFASKWLTPRLHRFMERHPEYDVHLEVTDVEIDLSRAQADVVLRYGAGRYAGAVSERVMDETVSPVCAPGYLKEARGIATPADLLSCRLIHEVGMTADWRRWFEMIGVLAPGRRGPGYSHESMSIEAAIRGEGVALGRSVLVAEDLAAGRLVELFPNDRLEVEMGYDLVYRPDSGEDPKVVSVRTWIADEVLQSSVPG